MRPIAIALLSVVGLAVMTVPSHARRCFVTVEDTDQWGNPDPSTLRTLPCRPGETKAGLKSITPIPVHMCFTRSGPPPLTPPPVVQHLC
jgi:hypothetical protein